MGNFTALKAHAVKVYKFTQGKTLPHLPHKVGTDGDVINEVNFSDDEFESLQSGVCASLAAAWLREKLTSPDALAFAGPSSGSAIHTGKNLATTVPAALKYLDYKSSVGEQLHASNNYILGLHGLSESAKTSNFNVVKTDRVPTVERSRQRDGTVYEKKTFTNVTNALDTLVNACDVRYLTKGRGVYISVTMTSTTPAKRGGGHAVAAYRSRGKTLYFFDPNCGVYEVHDVRGFFRAWIDCYGTIGYAVEHSPGGTRMDRFIYVDRP
jgi:hypothetical protein